MRFSTAAPQGRPVSPTSHDHHRLIRKLEIASKLTAEDKTAICRLPMKSRAFEKGGDLVRQGDRPQHACLIVEGVVCRYRIISRGRRQILSVHMPGDIPDLQSLFLEVMDHGLAPLTKGRAVFIPHSALRDLIHAWPNVASALWRDTLVDASIFRDAIAGLGRRSARERVAHLICELAVRLDVLDLIEGTGFPLPLTQAELADALGITNIHVNRVLQGLRAEGLIKTKGKQVQIEDWAALCAAGDFDLEYLHLRPEAIPDELKAESPPVSRT
jgi:CRP-like cAMP-binding protein